MILSNRWLRHSSTKETSSFAKAREEKICSLIKNGTFHAVNISSVGKDNRIFGSKFVQRLKPVDDADWYKSQLDAQNNEDKQAANILKKAPTVERFEQRFILSLAATMGEASPHISNITQTCIQSATALDREIYIRSPKELNSPPDLKRKVVKPLYWIPASSLHWHLINWDHHISSLYLIQSCVNPCLLVQKKETSLLAMANLQVESSIMVETEIFL